ncbi:aspartic proteinase-like protein 2 [Hordeum vulgare]|nr:aspartic proteinase-like protein 2 [Hordeum vulgare]
MTPTNPKTDLHPSRQSHGVRRLQGPTDGAASRSSGPPPPPRTVDGARPGRAAATGVFEVRCKFPRHDGSGKHLANLRAHDARRHGRSLTAAVDLPLGSNGLPTKTG